MLFPPEQHGVYIESTWDRDGLQLMPHPHSDQWIRPPYTAKCGSSGSVHFSCCRNSQGFTARRRQEQKKRTWRGVVYASIVRNFGLSYVFLCCTQLSTPWSALAFPLRSGAELHPARQYSGAAIVIEHIMVQQEQLHFLFGRPHSTAVHCIFVVHQMGVHNAWDHAGETIFQRAQVRMT